MLTEENIRQLRSVGIFFLVVISYFAWTVYVGGCDLKLRIKPIHEAACRGDTTAILAEVRKGVSVDERDSNGGTPLWHALRCHQFKTAEELLRMGADTKTKDKSNRDIHQVLAYSDFEIKMWLEDHGR